MVQKIKLTLAKTYMHVHIHNKSDLTCVVKIKFYSHISGHIWLKQPHNETTSFKYVVLYCRECLPDLHM